MSLDENKALYRRWIDEVGNTRAWDRIDEFIASDFIDHAAAPGTPAGPVGVRQTVEATGASPATHVTIEDLIAEGDQVWARIVVRGLPHGNLQAVDMVRIANGKLVEHWLVAQPLP